ncbi:MAG: cadherin-like beta sandwich domain-containing protein [Chloroflexi bacterium]|nr:cadherin-like beta sandwich domain-containing protein [Chloroflexota bacterium]
MMRASSFLRLSPLLLLTVALVAAAVLFPGGAPAEAQAPATVTRWVQIDPLGKLLGPVEVRAGNYYKVVMADPEARRVSSVASIREGELGEMALVVGTSTTVGIPDFACRTYDGTANDVEDYVGSDAAGFPILATSEDPNTMEVVSTWDADKGYQTLPIVIKAEELKDATTGSNPEPAKTNTLEPIEYFEVECLPTGTGSNLWRAGGQGGARIRVEIIDQGTDTRLTNLDVKSSTDGTTFSTSNLPLSPMVTTATLTDTEYSVSVGGTVTHVNVQPQTNNKDATVTVNGETVDRGSTSGAIELFEGNSYTDINVRVTASDGTTTLDYTVTVIKVPATLSGLEVLDEYGSLVTRPSFNEFWPEQSQVIYVAPGIRRIKIKPSWRAGATMTVTVSTTDMTFKNRTYSTATVTTSGAESEYLTISSFGGTKLNISVTEGSDTVEYTRKYVTRETNAANADNYLNYMGLSPNPNARNARPPTSWLQDAGSPGYFNVLLRDWSADDGAAPTFAEQTDLPWPALPMASSVYARALETYTPAVPEPQQNTASITLTPAFDPEVHDYTATVPYEVSSVFVNLGISNPKATATVNGNSPSTPVNLDVGENVVEVVVTAESGVRRTYTVTITREPSNRPPTVANAIADATIDNESGTHEASLSNVFSDPDNDALRVTASSSDKSVAPVSVSAGYSTLTVTAKSRGTATITVNASDGNGGSVDDSFTVTVKSAPVAASSIADVSALEVDATQEVSLSSVFSDADGDGLTITAASSDEGKATVSVSADQSKLTVTGVAEGTATITVTAQDADGNTATDTFDVTTNAPAQPEPVQPQPIASEPEQEPQLQQQAAQLPGAVTNLTVLPRNTNITVSWEAPTEGGAITGYIAHIKPVGGGDGHTLTPDADKTTVKFRRLNRATEYLIWVRAVNEEGKGERTPIRTATK